MELETILKTIAEYYTQYLVPYLGAEYQGEAFHRFELPHLIVLGTTLLLTLLIIFTGRRPESAGFQVAKEIRIVLKIAFVIRILSHDAWRE